MQVKIVPLYFRVYYIRNFRFDFDITNICLGDAQHIAKNVTCEDQREALDSALSAIGGLGKINSLLSVSYMYVVAGGLGVGSTKYLF